ncbi:ferredoxin--NADP reductase [Gilvibacter sp.]|uniref:ferredoxin--NADP reductase n=1 Tax=Gilvibacter sp. TaxID=2729997 RepID=UPI0025BCD7C5|nr:ferredoxin--NADP reductase [Gilvibacter sp.]NQX77830.1 ferredoxin--NADP reductase [Gilvibacter sp.]
MADFHELQIAALESQSNTAVSIKFQVPATLSNDYQFGAGQYVNLSAIIDGKEVRRAYSICSSPKSGDLTVLVKKVENGVFSTYANTALSVGDTLKVATPEGRFVLPESKTANYLFFAAGSGITPILSMISDCLENRPDTKMVLVYGNKTPEGAIFKEVLEDLQGQYPDRLQIEWIYSRGDGDNYHFGRIDRSKVGFTVNNKYQDTAFDDAFVCGPGDMIDTVIEALADFGMAEQNIHFERFTVSSDDDEITTSEVPDGNAAITFIIDDESNTITAPHAESVLDSALKHDLDAPYSCQGGICSSCIARVTSGTVEMRKNQILTDAEVAEGLVLTCQAHATSAQVTIDYDDV